MGSLKIGIKYVECKTFVMLCARRRQRENITSVLLKKRWVGGRWVDALPWASYIGKFRGLLLLTTVMSLSED